MCISKTKTLKSKSYEGFNYIQSSKNYLEQTALKQTDFIRVLMKYISKKYNYK